MFSVPAAESRVQVSPSRRPKAAATYHFMVTATVEPSVLMRVLELFEERDILGHVRVVMPHFEAGLRRAGTLEARGETAQDEAKVEDAVLIAAAALEGKELSEEELALDEIFEAVLDHEDKLTAQLVAQGLERGMTVHSLLDDALIAAMDEVGEAFAKGTIFVPEMLMAARAMKAGLEILRPILSQSGEPPKGLVLQSGKPSPYFEEEIRDKDGVLRTWLTAKMPVRISRGVLRYIVSTSLDITELKARERDLKQAQKMDAVGKLTGSAYLLGKVIGKQGRTARSIRTILAAAAAKVDKRVVFEILE